MIFFTIFVPWEKKTFYKVKVWLGYQKGPSPFVSSGPPHLKHVVTHIHIESLIFFMDTYNNKVLLHVIFEQVFGFLPNSEFFFHDFASIKKKGSRTHK
jgi:hypothetical protein